MINSLDYNLEEKRKKYESGKINRNDLSEEEKIKLIEYYKEEIKSTEKEIEYTKMKIKNVKNKIDNIV